MDAAAVVPQEPAAMEASKHSGFARSKGDANRRVITAPPSPGCGTGRKSLSDITNLAAAGPRMRSVGQEKASPAADPYDDRTRLIKENSALLKLVAERNQMIEMSNIEVQKLRVALQKTSQQNWQLAQANSQMIAELNLGKDRLKNMQHELGCASALLQAKTIELEELKKTIKKNKTLPNEMECQKDDAVEITAEPCHPAGQKKPCNVARKRPLRTQSLGPGVAAPGATSKENDECRRRSLRRKSSNLKSEEPCEPKGELFEIEDIKFPIQSQATEIAHEEETCATSTDAILDNNTMTPAKIEDSEKDSRSSATAEQNQVSRRSSIGRPSRKAAEKVTCYKEIPLNIKMRRD